MARTSKTEKIGRTCSQCRVEFFSRNRAAEVCSGCATQDEVERVDYPESRRRGRRLNFTVSSEWASYFDVMQQLTGND
jgi:hypothetical protein